MRNLIRLAMLAVLSYGCLSAAVVSYTVTNLNMTNGNGQPLYRYIYNLTGAPLLANQELDIRFEVTRYAAISNGVAPPSGFDLLLLPVNNPPGADGRYSLLSLVNNPTMIGTFSVDFAFIGSGQPGAQTFFINLLNSSGGFIRQDDSGFTVAGSSSSSSGGGSIPEPGTLLLSAAGVALLALARRR